LDGGWLRGPWAAGFESGFHFSRPLIGWISQGLVWGVSKNISTGRRVRGTRQIYFFPGFPGPCSRQVGGGGTRWGVGGPAGRKAGATGNVGKQKKAAEVVSKIYLFKKKRLAEAMSVKSWEFSFLSLGWGRTGIVPAKGGWGRPNFRSGGFWARERKGKGRGTGPQGANTQKGGEPTSNFFACLRFFLGGETQKGKWGSCSWGKEERPREGGEKQKPKDIGEGGGPCSKGGRIGRFRYRMEEGPIYGGRTTNVSEIRQGVTGGRHEWDPRKVLFPSLSLFAPSSPFTVGGCLEGGRENSRRSIFRVKNGGPTTTGGKITASVGILGSVSGNGGTITPHWFT